jgi:glycosyltransferase involved in cell wall biosynthesis
MRILIAADVWMGQIGGMPRTLDATVRALRELPDTSVDVIHSRQFRYHVSLPGDPALCLPLFRRRTLESMMARYEPDAIHIPVEGTLGFAVRRYCLARGIPFTTAFTTKSPEYAEARYRIPASVGYALLRRFHGAAERCLVATPSLADELRARGFDNIALWPRGVDLELFRPVGKSWLDAPRPIWIYVGRVAVEKNITAFLDLELPGTKYVVGRGPQLSELRAKYPSVRFTGMLSGEALVRHISSSDVFVFPSLTDTFGLVMLEALACGVPVAAYRVTGSRDVIGTSGAGVLDEDLGRAARAALDIESATCRAHAERYTWSASARELRDNLAPITRP